MGNFCNVCGTQLNEGTKFCTNCGTQILQGQEPQPTPVIINQINTADNTRQSGFDGTVFETFVASLGASIIIMLTLGFGTPWAICFLWRFIISHVTIDGRKLTFDGTGGQLFGNWLKWFLLTIITLGIYGFWVAPRLYHWIAKHTHFA